MVAALRRHRVAWFLAVTFAVTWGSWIPLAIAHRSVTVGFVPQYLLGLVGPLIGAVVATAICDGRQGLRDLLARMVRVRVAPRWWAVALVLPIAVALASYAIVAGYSIFLLAPVALPRTGTLGQFNGFPITNAVGMFVMLVAINGFGEETGWRGYLLPELQRDHPPLVSSLVIAAIWAIWHLPAFFITETYRQLPPALIPMFVLGLVCGSVFLTWLYNHARSSILVVAVWHGTYNLLTGSVGARGGLAAVETMVVVAIAIGLVIQEVRTHHVIAAEPR
jgi:membrane protease YdiL (CAAX protease family)